MKQLLFPIALLFLCSTCYASTSMDIQLSYFSMELVDFVIDTIPETDSLPAKEKTLMEQGELVFKTVDQMPIFPGCEEYKGSNEELEKCARKELDQMVIVYPVEAKAKQIDGTVVLQCIIDKSGKMREMKIVRDIGGGCGEAAVEVVSQLPDWTPGMQEGEPANVLYTLPIRFRLNNTTRQKSPKVERPQRGTRVKKPKGF